MYTGIKSKQPLHNIFRTEQLLSSKSPETSSQVGRWVPLSPRGNCLQQFHLPFLLRANSQLKLRWLLTGPPKRILCFCQDIVPPMWLNSQRRRMSFCCAAEDYVFSLDYFHRIIINGSLGCGDLCNNGRTGACSATTRDHCGGTLQQSSVPMRRS